MPMRRIAVVGGGWSGLACAERLATSRPGLEICLFEAAPQLGGRARGLLWDDHVPIDAGQHLLIDAYTETIALLRRADALGTGHWERDWLRWTSHALSPDGRSSEKVTLTGLLPDLLAAWPRLMQAPRGRVSVQGWLAQSGASAALIHHLLRPLAEGALNTDWCEASATCFQQVLRDATRRGPLSLRTLHPRRNLSLDGIDPLASRLRHLAVRVHLRRRVEAVTACGGGAWELRLSQGATEGCFDEVVLALPHGAMSRILHRPSRQASASSRAIGTLFLLLPPDVPVRSSGAIHAFQDPHGLHGPIVALARPPGPWGQVLSFVVSALPSSRDEHDSARVRAEQVAAQWLGGQHSSLKRHWIVDRQATWAATPAACSLQPRHGAFRSLGSGLWHCSDEMVQDYPATIESAVRSGRAAADALLA